MPVGSAAALPTTHCLCETVQRKQKLRIKDGQAGIHLAYESDDASCVS